jgi:hypothetical protein
VKAELEELEELDELDELTRHGAGGMLAPLAGDVRGREGGDVKGQAGHG